ncbi:Phosphatidylinositol-glycan biosynthesis, class O protein [Giardia muris]|uniref:Phosphatidylinositol-glycan biosynthesis, class O protein n=1 Tax=Giardia muris TaxID=5742 RepID=A0A4Z1T921_GIAMU|nr:Phosphatidylinositol-glycan biosynthesis, class O protein [Giardia muris]|eukprot:TNJ29019.1 Phosphatidylinositol-glycan biosynthesis, class O protein [Giardia muris]
MLIFLSTTLAMHVGIVLIDGMRRDQLLVGESVSSNFPGLARLADTSSYLAGTIIVETVTYTTSCLYSLFAGRVLHPFYLSLALMPGVLHGFTKAPLLQMLGELGIERTAAGDDTLCKLFGDQLDACNVAYSYLVDDYDSVDDLVMRVGLYRSGFSYSHLLGADHIMHREGLISHTLQERFLLYDKALSEYLQEVQEREDDFLVVILSDHGMTELGTHGDMSDAETRVPLLVFGDEKTILQLKERPWEHTFRQTHVLFTLLNAIHPSIKPLTDEITLLNTIPDIVQGIAHVIMVALLIHHVYHGANCSFVIAVLCLLVSTCHTITVHEKLFSTILFVIHIRPRRVLLSKWHILAALLWSGAIWTVSNGLVEIVLIPLLTLYSMPSTDVVRFVTLRFILALQSHTSIATLSLDKIRPPVIPSRVFLSLTLTSLVPCILLHPWHIYLQLVADLTACGVFRYHHLYSQAVQRLLPTMLQAFLVFMAPKNERNTRRPDRGPGEV